MKKELPVKYPPITSLMTHASILSIITTTDDYIPWFIFNFIQMSVEDSGLDFYNFYNTDFLCPHIEVIPLSREFYKDFINIDIINFIIKCIRQNYYIIPIIDQYYISNYSSYKKYHVSHPILIYGYNYLNNLFSAGDFFRDGKYSFDKVSFQELQEAYLNYNNDYWLKGIKIIKKVDYIHIFRLNDFINLLQRYLDGYEHSTNYNHLLSNYREKFGLNQVYDKLNSEMEHFHNSKDFDFRTLPIFCDHKKVLIIAVEYLIRIGYTNLEGLLSAFRQLFDQVIIFRNKFIKSMLKKENDQFDYSELDDIKNTEIKLLRKTMSILESSTPLIKREIK